MALITIDTYKEAEDALRRSVEALLQILVDRKDLHSCEERNEEIGDQDSHNRKHEGRHGIAKIVMVRPCG